MIDFIGIARALDQMDLDCTDWEAGFLETVLRQQIHSPKQQAVLRQMAERYLDAGLVAELYGQTRLWEGTP